MKKILVLTADTIGEKMAGPAIRALHIAKFLSSFFFVTLCAKTTSSKPPLPFDLVDISGVEKIIPTMDIIVGHGLFFHKYRFKKREGQKIIIDLYNIFLTENAILYKDYPEELKSYSYQLDLYKLNFQLLLGDHFLCANTPQFHFLTGMLTALNKINISNLESIPITIIPFGIDETEATSEKRALKGVHPGIDAKDKVLLWGGGIWDWLDPFTVIRAMKLLSQKRDDIKLFFMGINSPTHGVVVSSKAPLIQMTKEMGLFKTSVFFNSWVPYEERSMYLLDADIGLSIHLETEETRFSNRTRILDYIWSGLPIISTTGDVMSECVDKHQLGRVVGFQDEVELAETILEMLDGEEKCTKYRKNIRSIRNIYTWSTVLLPLKSLCEGIEDGPADTGRKISFKVGNKISLAPIPLLWSGIRVKGFSDTWKKIRTVLGGKFG